MFYDKPVVLYLKGEATKVRGELIYPPPDRVDDLMVDIQPYSSELARREYGLDIKVTKRMFCDVITIVPGKNLIEYQNKTYEVTEVVPWDDYLEVMLDGSR